MATNRVSKAGAKKYAEMKVSDAEINRRAKERRDEVEAIAPAADIGNPNKGFLVSDGPPSQGVQKTRVGTREEYVREVRRNRQINKRVIKNGPDGPDWKRLFGTKKASRERPKSLGDKAKKAWADTKAMAGKLLVPKADPNSAEYKAWKAQKDAKAKVAKRKYDLSMTK